MRDQISNLCARHETRLLALNTGVQAEVGEGAAVYRRRLGRKWWCTGGKRVKDGEDMGNSAQYEEDASNVNTGWHWAEFQR